MRGRGGFAMIRDVELAARLVVYRPAREGLVPPPMPINLTFSVTVRCNSRCRTCRIWRTCGEHGGDPRGELSLAEIDRTFESIGRVFFFNISGGEPFLREDLPDIVLSACRRLSPRVVHVPTNALLGTRVVETTRSILDRMNGAGFGTVKLTLKPSMDGVAEDHDWIRGVRGNSLRLLAVVEGLKLLRSMYPNLRIGLGTILSTMNLHRMPAILEAVDSLGVDTFISEVAEERAEMGNAGSGITPPAEAYGAAIRALQDRTFREMRKLGGLDLVTQAMRIHYYDLTTRWLSLRRQPIPCYAGISNAHVSAAGEVWPCAVRGDAASFGNLRSAGFDFGRLWRSDRARAVRASIRAGDCDCPLANQAYANILLHPRSMARVAALVARSRIPSVASRDGDAQRRASARAAAGDAPEAVEYAPDAAHPLDCEAPELLDRMRELGLRMRIPGAPD